ncbi:MAG TPA: flagellar export protein FliJ [Spirochaetia bacterium]|nr:flagellar export protein FliJ [Spirochaetia bacterium]
MRRFHFRLERFLDLKRYTEREWELALASITGQCFMIEQDIKNREAEILERLGKRSWPTGKMDLNALYSMEMYLTRLENEIRQFEVELAKKQAKRREVQKKYLDASRERKVLDKLKERKESEYYQEQKKEEFKVQDDITTGSVARRNVVEGV